MITNKKLTKKEKEEKLEKRIFEIQKKIENNKDKSKPRIKITEKELAMEKLYRLEQQKSKTLESIKSQEEKDEKKIRGNLSKIIKIARDEFKIEILKEHKGYFLMWGLLEKLSKKSVDEIEELIKIGQEVLYINNLENPVFKSEKLEK